MGKIKIHSLKWSFITYLSICTIIVLIGTLVIGHATNYMQEWYMQTFSSKVNLHSTFVYEVHIDHTVCRIIDPAELKGNRLIIYNIISYAQFVLIPLLVIGSIGITGIIFYNRLMKSPINILLNASKKISNNELDFQIKHCKNNELGMLCQAFEQMRAALYQNNLEIWHSLEERKRLNSAFSHDLRIPLTVLHGYTDFLQKYIPNGKISQDKLLNVLSMMNNQISRLEHYTVQMNSLQKLDDIISQPDIIHIDKFQQQLLQTGNLLCTDKTFKLISAIPKNISYIKFDSELAMQTYENLLSNAVRYAKNNILTELSVTDDLLSISVLDDGNGFSDEALNKADSPFYRDENEEDKTHFGLGLYICRILCEKCGGKLSISNSEKGGKVTASFGYQKISE